MGLNVSNMPMNKIHKFSDNGYVWSIMLNETRGGNYSTNEPKKYTEVYRIDSDGFLIRVASGRLVDNPSLNDYEHRFSIFDYDKDCDLTFFVEKEFKEVSLDDLFKLQKAIPQKYNNRSR